MADAGMIGSLVGGLLAGDGIVIPVGAIAVLIVGTGMRWGTRWVDHRGWGPPRSLRSVPSGGRDCPAVSGWQPSSPAISSSRVWRGGWH